MKKYVIVEDGKVVASGSCPFNRNGIESISASGNPKMGASYNSTTKKFTSPVDNKEDRENAYEWACKQLLNGDLLGDTKWIRAVKYPHLRTLLSVTDWRGLIDAWKAS